MKKIAMSLVTIAAVAIMSIGATGAYFSDTVTLTDNTFSSDTLKLTVNDTHNGATQTFHVSHLHPGSNNLLGQYVLKNVGTMTGNAWMEVKDLSVDGDGKLGDLVKLQVVRDGSSVILGYTEMLNQEPGKRLELGNMLQDAQQTVLVNVLWNPTTDSNDNLAQGQTATFDVVFHLDQIH